jgi:hypothetical protein
MVGLRALALLGVLAAGHAPASAAPPPSGFEVALHGEPSVLAGRPARFRGVAYRVLGLAELVPLPGARVSARCSSAGARREPGRQAPAWRETRADGRGFFQIDVPMPERLAAPRLELRVGDGKAPRRFSFPLRLERPWEMDLYTDRRLYQAGETIHAWARLRDARSGRPLAHQSIRFTLTGTAVQARPVRTDASGVASLTDVVPPQASEGSHELIAQLVHEEVRRSYQIGVRTYERLLAAIKLTPATAQPHQRITVEVKVTTPSGAPVRRARVELKVDAEASGSGVTDGRGVAAIAARAPAYMTHATGRVPVVVRVAHPAHGSLLARETLKLAVPLALEVTAVAPNAGLVPELDGALYLQLQDGGGDPAPAGTPIDVRGAAVRGGRQRAQTDRHGLARVPVRLPLGAAAGDSGGDRGDDEAPTHTTLVVQIEGAAPRTAVVSVPVRAEVEVRPSVDPPVVAPGAPLTLKLARRASARGLPAVVELLSASGLIEARVVAPGEDRLALRAPKDRLGVIQVRARALRQRGVVEGAGGLDAFLVRPAQPWFPTLRASRDVYKVRSTAELILETAPGGPPGWAALLVRDLAAHGGELPFELYYLRKAFDRAVLDPSTRAAETLLRTALAAHVQQDPAPRQAPALLDALGQPLEGESGLEAAPGRGVLRDPFPLADELRRRGVGRVMSELERLLASALDDGRLDEVTRGRGAARRFRAKLLDELDDVPPTLGDGKLTLAMLEATDPSFSYGNVARRVARARLVRLLAALARYLDPGDDATPRQRAAAREPAARWLGRMVERGHLRPEQLADPWGGRFSLRPSRRPALRVAVEAAGLELVSPGPDGRPGTRDDVRDPFARAVPAGTPYAVASGEDALMRKLARLSTDRELIEHLQEAYKRAAAEVAEEAIGDAVRASVSEGDGTIGLGKLGTIGRGGGGGSGSGYGRGAGQLSGRSARVPQVVGGMAALAAIVRERFPPTLAFRPSLPLDPSGKTRLTLPLSDAVTSYQVEAVVWSAEGWTWSASTRLRVDQEIVVDAPVPARATVGDVLRLPVRIGNRAARPQPLTLTLLPHTAGAAPLYERAGVVVPAQDSLELPVELRLTRPLAGRLLIAARAVDGTPLDAVRRPLLVEPAVRRVRRELETLAAGVGSLELEVPAQAVAREGAELRVRVGVGLFDAPGEPGWAAWAEAWTTSPSLATTVVEGVRRGDGAALARAVASSWAAGESAVSDQLLRAGLTRLARTLDRLARSSLLRDQVEILLGLAPAVAGGQLRARPELAASLEATLRTLRRQVSEAVGEVADEPSLWAAAAAALAWTAPAGADLARVRELVRRVRRRQLTVGPHTWVAAGGPATSALLALAELKLDERGRAFALVRTLSQKRSLGQESLALGRAAAALLARGAPPRSVSLRVDGRERRLELSGGLGRIAAPELSRPGRHRVSVELPAASAPLHLQVVTEYGVPWSLRPDRPGPLELSIVGTTGARDQRAGLAIAVRNRSPRTLGAPVLELALPAGAELDEEARAALRRRTVSEPAMSRGTLRLELASLPPGGFRCLPLPLRWSLGGRLLGLGVVGYAADRPEDLSIFPPRVLEIADAERKP